MPTPLPLRKANGSASPTSLPERLAAVLPKGHSFGVYHLSTPPIKTEPLCAAPPNERPDKTFRENHFLALSIDVPKHAIPSKTPNDDASKDKDKDGSERVLVFAFEIYIFTTAHSTTIFVAKADSTGYLHLLNLPKGSPSPIRDVATAFLSHLVENRRRRDKQCVVSLFARAQDQYLFPGSVKNVGKHVLGDRGLVRWWCRVLDPLVEAPPTGSQPAWKSVKGYLIVPGLDVYETRAFLPRTTRAAENWALEHPLELISHYTQEYDFVPPRCLIPGFPDDPKARFRDELDEEAAQSAMMKKGGSWKSVRSLEQFWELMAFRQECSSGRLTGFIWVVFDAVEQKTPPADASSTQASTTPASQPAQGPQDDPPSTPPRKSKTITTPFTTPFTTPRKLLLTPSKPGEAPAAPPSPSDKRKQDIAKRRKEKKEKKKKKKNTGIIKPRQPHIKTHQRNHLAGRAPASCAYYHWPLEGRGEKLVSEKGYKRVVELLMHLEFAKLETAAGATRRWVGEVGMGEGWGVDVVGEREVVVAEGKGNGAGGAVNDLAGLVKRKRAPSGPAEGVTVNVLGAGLVRKKPKPESSS